MCPHCGLFNQRTRGGERTHAFGPPIRPLVVSGNDMRVVQSNIEEWNTKKEYVQQGDEKRNDRIGGGWKREQKEKRAETTEDDSIF